MKLYLYIPGEYLSATQKSWSGLGSEAMAWEAANARETARRKYEEAAIICFSLALLLCLRSAPWSRLNNWLCLFCWCLGQVGVGCAYIATAWGGVQFWTTEQVKLKWQVWRNGLWLLEPCWWKRTPLLTFESYVAFNIFALYYQI